MDVSEAEITEYDTVLGIVRIYEPFGFFTSSLLYGTSYSNAKAY